MINFKDLKKPYFIAEIGINHNADIQIVKKLIDAAFACGWDCVKFQKRVPEIATPEAQKNIMRDTPWGRMTYLEYKKKMEFGKEEYDYIDKYCKEKPIDWTVSVWDVPSLEFILKYDVPFIKIPSAKLTEKELLASAAKTGKPIILSTGMSTLEEIDQAVEILKANSANFLLMHCNSVYPAAKEELNVSCIKTLEERYNCPIGYSGHEYDLDPSVYAAVLGAKIIERHITIDHGLWGTDQAASLEVHAMDLLRKRIKDVDVILGTGNKIVTETEKEVRKKLRGDVPIIMNQKEKIPVIILCGGLGTRLREETEFRPKPLVEIGGKPILWHIMKTYSHYGFNNFILCLGYKGSMIKEYFSHYNLLNKDFTITLGQNSEPVVHNDHCEKDWRITFVDTGEDALKGARLKRAEKYIDGDTFMVTYGDGVSNVDISKLLEFHKQHGKLATLTGVRPPSRFGELILEGDRIKKFEEKPQSDNKPINGGFFVFNRKIFDYLEDKDECDLERGALEKVAESGELMMYRHPDFWYCMDTPRDFDYLRNMWRNGNVPWKRWKD